MWNSQYWYPHNTDSSQYWYPRVHGHLIEVQLHFADKTIFQMIGKLYIIRGWISSISLISGHTALGTVDVQLNMPNITKLNINHSQILPSPLYQTSSFLFPVLFHHFLSVFLKLKKGVDTLLLSESILSAQKFSYNCKQI